MHHEAQAEDTRGQGGQPGQWEGVPTHGRFDVFNTELFGTNP